MSGGFTTGSGAGTTGPTVSLQGTYNQTLFDNMKSDADIEAARAATEASRYGLQSAEQTVLLAVATAYFTIIETSSSSRSPTTTSRSSVRRRGRPTIG